MRRSYCPDGKFERSINENLTIIIGQNWRIEENLKLFSEKTSDRLTRLDDRVTEAHKDLAELEIAVRNSNQKLDKILTLLRRGQPKEG